MLRKKIKGNLLERVIVSSEFRFKQFILSLFLPFLSVLQITKLANDDNYIKNFTLYFYSLVQSIVQYNITKEIYIHFVMLICRKQTKIYRGPTKNTT